MFPQFIFGALSGGHVRRNMDDILQFALRRKCGRAGKQIDAVQRRGFHLEALVDRLKLGAGVGVAEELAASRGAHRLFGQASDAQGGAIRGDNPMLRIGNEDRMADGLKDFFPILARLLQRLLGLFPLARPLVEMARNQADSPAAKQPEQQIRRAEHGGFFIRFGVIRVHRHGDINAAAHVADVVPLLRMASQAARRGFQRHHRPQIRLAVDCRAGADGRNVPL